MDQMTMLELLLVSLPEGMLVAALGITLAGFRPRPEQLLTIGAVHALASYVIRLSPAPFGLHTIVLLLVFILTIHMVTRLNLVTSALAGLAGLTVFAAVETLVSPLLLQITGRTFENALADPLLRIYYFFPEAVALLSIILLCRRYDLSILSYWKKLKQTGESTMPTNEKDPDENFFIRQYFPLIALVLCPIFLLALLNSAFYVSRSSSLPDHYWNVFTTFVSLAVMALTVLSAGAVKKVSKVIEVEYSARQTAETLSRMEEIIRSIRKQRHDFNHHLQTVYGFLEVGSHQKARDYIRNTFSAIATPGELVKTDNHEISAMLYTKIGLAEAKNINIEVIINCGLKDLPLKSREANSILGNLIDNAVTAVENAAWERRRITVEITRGANEFNLTVVNRGGPVKPEIMKQIFEPGFSTRKERQGLGLAIVKETAERYNGSVSVSSNDEETIFTVRIPAKK